MGTTASMTTAQMWSAAASVAAVDLLLAVLLTRWIRPPWQPRLPTALLALGALWFAALFTWAFRTFWDDCYGAVLPGWFRTIAPLVGAGLGSLGWGMWWAARRISDRWCVPVFLSLGALESVPGHLTAIYGRGLLEHCMPVLGVTPVSAMVFGLFEFALYWSVILALAGLVARGSHASRAA